MKRNGGSCVPSNSTSSSAFLAIFWGGLACGVFDITQACVGYGIQNHLPPQRIFQSVASGLLGPESRFRAARRPRRWGFPAFLIAFSWAAGYYVASRQICISDGEAGDRGIVVWRVRLGGDELVVLPLSAVHRWPPRSDPASIITGPIGHTVLVGLPIALAVWKWAPKR